MSTETLMLWATVVMAVSTVVYVVFTGVLVYQARKQRIAQFRPNVVVFANPGREHINLAEMTIANVGGGPAYDLKLSLMGDMVVAGHEKLSDLGPFKNGFKYLAPSQRVQFMMTNLLRDDSLKEEITVAVKYRDSAGDSFDGKFPITFSGWEGVAPIEEDSMVIVAKHLEKLTKEIRSVKDVLNRNLQLSMRNRNR